MTAYSIFNKTKTDFTKQPLFFGENLNFDNDNHKYPVFEYLTEKQDSSYWRPQEIDLTKDQADFVALSDELKFIFTANLRYQTLLDAVQSRGPIIALSPYCSNPALGDCLLVWANYERIHSRTYKYIFKNVYPDPRMVMDSILETDEIIQRAYSVTKYYDDFISFASSWVHQGKPNDWMYALHQKLYLALIAINILEGIRFYVSFACTFAFAELMKMEGSAKEVQLIARDENFHLAITQHIINIYSSGQEGPLMVKVIQDCHNDVMEMYKGAVEEEKRWANFLFKDGSMIGLNEKLLGNYIDYIANRRLKTIGYEPVFGNKSHTNPLPWMSKWLNAKELQVSPQETQLISYKVGAIKQNLNVKDLKSFKL